MKPKFTLEDLANAMYSSVDHSDIREDWSGYDYSIAVSADGSLGHSADCETFKAGFDFTADLWDGIDQDDFLHNLELMGKGWYSCIDDPDQQEADTYTLLNRADDQEDLSNPNFREAAEAMYDEICEWLES